MTTVVTLPIKCSTVKRANELVPVVAFWIIMVISIVTIGLLGYAGTLTNYPIEKVMFVSIVELPMLVLLLFLTCPYKFECIKE
jgi:hypothetical protein